MGVQTAVAQAACSREHYGDCWLSRADQDYEARSGQNAHRKAGRLESAGFRDLRDARMARDGHAMRKAAFATLQTFLVEKALLVLPVINFAVTQFMHGRNHALGFLTAPRLHGMDWRLTPAAVRT
jgi:hypothetical protein